MHRTAYLIWTAATLATAYVLLRIVVEEAGSSLAVFPDAWQLLDPFRLIAAEGSAFRWSVGIHVALTIGLIILSVLRALDAGWPPWIGGLMLLPVVRLFVFTALAAVPESASGRPSAHPLHARLRRMLPESRSFSAITSAFVSVLLVLPLGYLGLHVVREYGLAVFIGLPFLIGMLSVFLHGCTAQRSFRESVGVAMLALTCAFLIIFLLAMEGLVCLVMAAPIAYPVALSGAIVGHSLSAFTREGLYAAGCLFLLAPALMALEKLYPPRETTFDVVTSVHVDAQAQTVWNELVAFSRLGEPDELLFRAGISYPVEARIEGRGVGACRYCWFNTGPFVEPITVWDEPRRLAFDVVDSPPPMTELSLYEHVDAPHLDGFFRSRRGEFRIVEQGEGRVLLEGTTWYTHDIWPTWYWRLWSDAILHRIHARVLEHIRREAEVREK